MTCKQTRTFHISNQYDSPSFSEEEYIRAAITTLKNRDWEAFSKTLASNPYFAQGTFIQENLLSYACTSGLTSFAERIRSFSPSTSVVHILKDSLNRSLEFEELASIQTTLSVEPALVTELFEGNTLLTCAIQKQNLALIDYLLTFPILLDLPTHTGETPLMRAAATQDLTLVEQLLTLGANIHAEDENGLTALTYACQSGSLKILHRLVQEYSDLNHQDHYGRTALYWAAFNGQSEHVSYLLFKGANPNLEDISEFSPVDLLIHDHEAPNRQSSINEFKRYFFHLNEKNQNLIHKNRLRLLFT